jgi:hypothetical protein
MDFNIFEILKNRPTTDGESGNTDALLIMVQNMEKKLLKKFEFVDEKIKKGEDETYKIKNEILNIKNNLDALLKNMLFAKEQIDILFPRLDDVSNNVKTQLDNTRNELKLLIEGIKNLQDIKLEE